MNKLVLILFATLFAGTASATGKGNNGNHGNNNGPKSGDRPASSSSSAGAIAAAGAVAGAASISGATGGNAQAIGGAGGAGGSAAGGTAIASVGAMSFNFTTPAAGPSFVSHDYSGMPQQAPAMGNSYISTSNSCDGAVGASLVLPGFGGSVSAATLRMMCEGRLNSQAHKALGQEDKARLTMEVVQEYACEEDAKWAKIARKKGLCAPAEEANAVAQTNPAFNSN